MNNLNRRAALLGGLAAITAALPARAAVAGKLTDEQFSLLSGTAKVPADYRRLAVHFRAIAAEHETEAKVWDEIAAGYKKRSPAGAEKSQADDLDRVCATPLNIAATPQRPSSISLKPMKAWPIASRRSSRPPRRAIRCSACGFPL
jgi:hypothetical protein